MKNLRLRKQKMQKMVTQFSAFLLLFALSSSISDANQIQKRHTMPAPTSKPKIEMGKGVTKTVQPRAKVRTGDLMNRKTNPVKKTGVTFQPDNDPCIGHDFCCQVATLATNNDTPSQNSEPAGDAGTTQFVYMGKQRLRSFDKTTLAPDGVLDIDMNRFWEPGSYSLGSSDPDVVFDHDSQQWFLFALSLGGNGTASTQTLAVSDYNSQSPGTITVDTVWTYYVFDGAELGGTPSTPSPTKTVDYQKLGVDANAVYLGNNLYDQFDFNYESSAITVINKASVLSGGPATYTIFNNLTNPGAFMEGLAQPFGPSAIQCANNYDIGDNATPFGWLADTDGSDFFTGNPPLPLIYVYRIDNPGTAPTMTRYDLPISPPSDPYFATHTVPIEGGLKGVSAGFWDFNSVMHIHSNILWAVGTVSVDQFGNSDPNNPNLDRTGLRWFAIDVSNPVPVIIDTDTIWDPAATNPRFFWYGAMITTEADGNGNAKLMISASAGGKADFWNNVIWTFDINVNNRTQGNLVNRSSIQGPVTVTQGNTPWNPTQDFLGSNSTYRDGDYHQACLDPDNVSLWTTGEFAYDPINWGVSLTHVTFDCGSPP
jgi:hypothetical protein